MKKQTGFVALVAGLLITFASPAMALDACVGVTIPKEVCGCDQSALEDYFKENKTEICVCQDGQLMSALMGNFSQSCQCQIPQMAMAVQAAYKEACKGFSAGESSSGGSSSSGSDIGGAGGVDLGSNGGGAASGPVSGGGAAGDVPMDKVGVTSSRCDYSSKINYNGGSVVEFKQSILPLLNQCHDFSVLLNDMGGLVMLEIPSSCFDDSVPTRARDMQRKIYELVVDMGIPSMNAGELLNIYADLVRKDFLVPMRQQQMEQACAEARSRGLPSVTMDDAVRDTNRRLDDMERSMEEIRSRLY